MPIHDELAIEVAPEEESYVPKVIKEMLEACGDVIKYVPMVVEVEATDTHWSEKKEVEL